MGKRFPGPAQLSALCRNDPLAQQLAQQICPSDVPACMAELLLQDGLRLSQLAMIAHCFNKTDGSFVPHVRRLFSRLRRSAFVSRHVRSHVSNRQKIPNVKKATIHATTKTCMDGFFSSASQSGASVLPDTASAVAAPMAAHTDRRQQQWIRPQRCRLPSIDVRKCFFLLSLPLPLPLQCLRP